MEHVIRDQVERLSTQRETLVFGLAELNENLPNYELKISNLDIQISNIDNRINDYFYMAKEIEILKLQNELAIKTQIKQ